MATVANDLRIVEPRRETFFLAILKQNSSIIRFQMEVSRELMRNVIHPTVYIFNENLVTLFTGNSRNNFIGRVAMNTKYTCIHYSEFCNGYRVTFVFNKRLKVGR